MNSWLRQLSIFGLIIAFITIMILVIVYKRPKSKPEEPAVAENETVDPELQKSIDTIVAIQNAVTNPKK